LLQIRLVRKEDTPVAAIMTLRHGSKIYYKYGCSDHHLHHFAGVPYLFWKLIEESKASGATEIDFGRSDSNQQGLIIFKDKLGTVKTGIEYLRHTRNPMPVATGAMVVATFAASKLFHMLPYPLLHALGKHLYRHMG
jgi:lipid II:glycine glycyltransferase (peptidoglycan interpeptide bridge formation enzyme)